MFLAVSAHPPHLADRMDRAVALHAEQLRSTGRFGTMSTRRFPGGAVYWDSGSFHAALFERDDHDAFLVRGGYTTIADEWHANGTHSTQAPGVGGEFAALSVTRDGDGHIIEARSDPAHSWPLYWARNDAHSIVSNDPHFVGIGLGSTSLSTQGAFEVLALTAAIGEDSTIEGVRALQPGHTVVVHARPEGTAHLSLPTVQTHRARTMTSPDAWADATYDALLASIATIPALADPDRVVTLTLSGGLDSRLTLGALAESTDIRQVAVTLDLSGPAELDIAHEVATTLGFPHRTAALGDVTIDTARAGWLLSGGQVSVHAASGNILSYDIAEKDADGNVTIVGAWPGDCLIGSFVPFQHMHVSPALHLWAEADYGRKLEPLWHENEVEVSGPRARDAVRRMRKNVRATLRRRRGATSARTISSWALFERQPRFGFTSPARLSSNVLAITPVLGREYVEHLLALRGREIIGKNFYRAMIFRRLPSLRGIPNANTGAVVSPEPALPPMVPADRPSLFGILPARVQTWVRTLRPGNHLTRPFDSAETVFWRGFLTELGVEPYVELDGLTVDARTHGDLRIQSVSLALRWTREYLEASAAALGPVPSGHVAAERV